MCHIQILDAILQKGDAYMYSQQYEEALQCFNSVIEKKLPQTLQTAHGIRKAASYHHQRDIYSITQTGNALSYFQKSDKEFQRIAKTGDTTFYPQWGELHLSMASYYYNQNMKEKCIAELIKAESLYDKYPINKVSQNYQKVKLLLKEYYRENNRMQDLHRCLSTYFAYCDTIKNNSIDTYNEYINTAIALGNLWSDYSVAPYMKYYFQIAKEGMDVLLDYGYKKDMRYMQTLYLLGESYWYIDSIYPALNLLEQCSTLNRQLLADNDAEQCLFNKLDIKSIMVKCYMELPDTEWTELYGDKALMLQKDIITHVSTMDTTTELKRNLGYHYKQLGKIYQKLEMGWTAIKQYDSSLAIFIPLYESGDRINTENDIADNYASIAYAYYLMEDRDDAKVIDYLNKCINICENAVSRNDILNEYYFAVCLMLDILTDPLFSPDETIIKKYNTLKSNLEKGIGKKH